MKLTPSQVKNLMSRGLRLLVDPEPEVAESQRAIGFFEHRCAYCGCEVGKGDGDLDHLISSAKGGRNHISNRVLSCKRCNAEEKRDKDWKQFLLEKHGPGQVFDERCSKILEWVQKAGAVQPLPKSSLQLLEQECKLVTSQYDQACRRVRNL